MGTDSSEHGQQYRQQRASAFPAIVWPLNRKEIGVGYSAVEPFRLGAASHMLPTIRAQAEDTISDTVCWQPASLQPDPLTNAILQEVGSPVTLRPATRVPGFLAESKNGNYKEMARQFEKLHKDLDIPHDLLSGAFKEAATDSAWDSSRYTEGSLISCCRPALGSQLLLEDVNADADREWYTAARFRKDVKPICDFSPGDGDGDGYDADEYSTGYGWSSHREWALYAGGECNNELWAAPLPAAGDEGDTFPSLQFRPNRGQSAQKTEVRASIEFTTSIKQIITNNLHPGFACVRTASMVGLLGVTQLFDRTSGIPHVDVDIVGCPYSYDDGDPWTCHASWSPWSASEAVLATGEGCVRIWDFEKRKDSLLKAKDALANCDIQWNCCEYWNSPRHILCANPDEVYFLDARVERSRTSIMSIPESDYAFDSELFTAICPSGFHPMHAVAASTHAIRVFDQRYLKQPVVAWKHNYPIADPPVHLQSLALPNYNKGKAAIVVAASKESSRIETFIYGQHSDDVPYISIEQSMLKQSTGASSVQETIQEALAIDPMENAKMTIGHGHVDRYTTPHLTGFAFCIMPQTPDPQALDDGVSAAIDAVCVVIDELGALIGHQLQIMASANTNTTGTNTTGTDTIYTPVFKSSIWQNSRVYEQAVIDGMGLVLMDKAAVDERRESYWSELRGRGMRYDRVDLQQVYQYLVQDVRSETGGLVQTANGEVADYSSLTRKAQSGVLKKIADMASRPISAYDISSAVISVLSSNGAGLAKELPSWTEDGKRIREVLLSLDPETLRERWRSGGLSELMEIVCEKASACRDKDNNGANNNDKDDDEHIQQALCSKFASASLSNSLTKASIGRASSDIKLANVRLQLAEGKGAQERAASEQTAQSSDPVSELESKLGTLSSHAGLLNDQWLNGAIADSSQTQQPPMPYGAGSQVSQARKRKSRPSQPAYTNSQTQTPGRVLAPESLRSTISARMSQPLFQSGRFEVVPETQFTSSMQSAFGASQFTQATADYFSAASAARPAQSLRSRTSQSQAKKKTRRSGF